MNENAENTKIGERPLSDLSRVELKRLDMALADFAEFLYSNSHRQTADEGANAVDPAKTE